MSAQTLTPAEYADARYPVCPVCKGDDIVAPSAYDCTNPFVDENGRECRACHSTWSNVYELVGYKDLRTGKP